ncbi:deoxyuridine 5'-triphosphate nucleotidohydrolase-like [Zingiber officinale]|uniref:deoxyuridine 5'-triphosphate nucleotidohydrolase-like n=1 Tax=Zingiber officinale TaxID=94328 RepID=UPI001C4ACC51|nr:deoxyuridine 5'-triphosphate nucleotidohydrolase-like [Zingiber officinale]
MAEPPRYNHRDEEIQSDEESLHTLAVLVEQASRVFAYIDDPVDETPEDQIYPNVPVYFSSPYAILPERKSSGTAGYDLAASHDCTIPPRGRAQIHTGIGMEIPWGRYG